jgi:hypothetical protein
MTTKTTAMKAMMSAIGCAISAEIISTGGSHGQNMR